MITDLFQVKAADTVWKGYHENEDNDGDDGSDLDGFIVDSDVED